VIDENGDPTLYTYTPANELETLTDAELNTTTWLYDGARRVPSETNEFNHARTYKYDGCIQRGTPFGSQRWVKRSAGRLDLHRTPPARPTSPEKKPLTVLPPFPSAHSISCRTTESRSTSSILEEPRHASL
jgi:hypothetical protein